MDVCAREWITVHVNRPTMVDEIATVKCRHCSLIDAVWRTLISRCCVVYLCTFIFTLNGHNENWISRYPACISLWASNAQNLDSWSSWWFANLPVVAFDDFFGGIFVFHFSRYFARVLWLSDRQPSDPLRETGVDRLEIHEIIAHMYINLYPTKKNRIS